MAINLLHPIKQTWRVLLLIGCLVLIALLVDAELYVGPETPLGGLFLVPLVVAAAYLPRWPIFLLAVATALAREYFGPNSLGPGTMERLALSTVAFAGVGLFSGELVRNRRMALELLQKVSRKCESARMRSRKPAPWSRAAPRACSRWTRKAR